jgi:transcriptional regulator with XRE-family HTH domain
MGSRAGLRRDVEAVSASIGANIRRLRRRNEVTQETLAERSDVALRFLQEIEAGTANVSITVLVAIARALNVRPQELMRPATLPKPLRGRPPESRRKAKAIK